MSKKSIKNLSFITLVVLFGMAAKCQFLNPKVKLPNVTLTFGDPVTLTIPLNKQEVTVTATIPIPDLEGAFLQINPTTKDKPGEVVLTVPRSAFDNPNFRLRDPATLPGGRALPNVPEGKLPHVAINVEKWHNVTFYLGVEVAALFIPTDKGDDVELTLPITDNSGRDIGFITKVPTDANKQNHGYFVMFNWNLATTNPLNGTATLRNEDIHRVKVNGKTLEELSDEELAEVWDKISEEFKF
ncbi:MAG: hypothetical protein A3B70_04295 [Deltaproteobacteria bacterium RIFCSPHIGHO2_02_FULL_40_11]|nr:MAG: hypothetical protein A3B70_04295 [Deltaproteobacteria bacterium RIFCSPHIGHO2_02_FULL_40_11]